ncbi:putative branched-chain-amino-acid aminotransferase [Colletotrichum spaethianum]|uniref:Branched-chain-amino-acid aminotransferase n=1 Tax=Colletotrichum spaethianum TaxID=700344 RepID=A0AA37LFV8_9PEZI|nr:putative branched-chain-amino-acid aminotransferase [Colletotrichum spaethianum]GKT43407.1 putative branched-chain-amino-acid aminotransferase [Colletotrichum spaethianum]
MANQITEASLRAVLTERLQAIHVEITDMSGGCGQAFTSTIVSPVFEKQTSLKRHRLVNAALKDEIAQIHAWSAKCQTPAEWERDRAAAGGASEGPRWTGPLGEESRALLSRWKLNKKHKVRSPNLNCTGKKRTAPVPRQL